MWRMCEAEDYQGVFVGGAEGGQEAFGGAGIQEVNSRVDSKQNEIIII